MEKIDKTVLITGGCGFIGSHLVRLFVTKYPTYKIVNLDAMTYAGNQDNLNDVEKEENYVYVHGSICDKHLVDKLFKMYDFDYVIHMAAESHVDRSMTNPTVFVDTNVMGTINLLNFVRKYWTEGNKERRFFNMITDEIFGSLSIDDPPFDENTPIDPHSPYSTSKAAQYLFGKTYFESYGLPIISLCCGNAIGGYQYLEKLVPLTIDRLINKQEIPIYGEGKQMRDWTNVHDICNAIDILVHDGSVGEMYCIGGDACITNIDLVKMIIREYCALTNNNVVEYEKLIKFIVDPRGKSHDFRYDLNHDKITNELGWTPKYTVNESVHETVEWYLENTEWCEALKKRDNSYDTWVLSHYGAKLKEKK